MPLASTSMSQKHLLVAQHDGPSSVDEHFSGDIKGVKRTGSPGSASLDGTRKRHKKTPDPTEDSSQSQAILHRAPIGLDVDWWRETLTTDISLSDLKTISQNLVVVGDMVDRAIIHKEKESLLPASDLQETQFEESESENGVASTGFGRPFFDAFHEDTDFDIPMEGVEEGAVDPDGIQHAHCQEVLTRVFKIPTFREKQYEIITKALARCDIFVLMPTGSGKSLCFQLPAVLEHERTNGAAVTVVISPLVSLIRDQTEALSAKGVDAVMLTQDSTPRWMESRLLGNSKPSLVYITPEKIQHSGELQAVLHSLYRGGNLFRFVVDECHCISQWGADFREAYFDLNTLRDQFPTVPIMALTATATPDMRREIISRLKLKNCAPFSQSLNRPNLEYIVVQKRNDVNEIIDFIEGKHSGQSGIIYRTGRTQCETLANLLRKRGLNAEQYHSGMTEAKKTSVQNDWQDGTCHIIVATVAFGMGIDKANVRFVVHYDLPKDPISYCQETGRAGRDGLPATCILFYSYRDAKKVLDLVTSTNISPEELLRRRKGVSAMVDYCQIQSVCRRVWLSKYFDQRLEQEDCDQVHCSNCGNEGRLTLRDLYTEATLALALVRSIQFNVTVAQVVSAFRGRDTTHIRKHRLKTCPGYGGGAALSQDIADVLFDELLHQEVLREEKIHTGGKHYHYYVKVGPHATDNLVDCQSFNLILAVNPIRGNSSQGATGTPESHAERRSRREPGHTHQNSPESEELPEQNSSYVKDRLTHGCDDEDEELGVYTNETVLSWEPKTWDFDDLSRVTYDELGSQKVLPPRSNETVLFSEPKTWNFDDLPRVTYDKLGLQIVMPPQSDDLFRRFLPHL